MERLEETLEGTRSQLERDLAAAEEELEALRARERSLETVIARARATLGLEVTVRGGRAPGAERGPALHDVLVQILREHGNEPMSAPELAAEVNRTARYRKGDGSSVDVGQIHARVHNYERLFVRQGGRIRLREPEPAAHDPELLERFDQAMLEVYDAAMREVHYPARRFLDMVRRRGGHEAARHLLAKPGVSEGFRRLAEARKLELTMEYQVVRPEFAPLFSPEERGVARSRLLEFGLREDELPREADRWRGLDSGVIGHRS